MARSRNQRRQEKKRRKLQRLENPRAVDNARGSVLWAYNHYRTQMLTSLLNDLIDLENDGLDEEYCQLVQKSLGYYVNSITAVAGGGFLTGNLHTEVERFERLYIEWNDINGKDPKHVKERRRLLVKLRDRRQKISDKVRTLQFELDNNLDRKVLADTYRAIGDLVTMVPDMLKSLSTAYSEYVKRGALAAA